ncbi:MAG TPA: ice-binding family protein [Ferruginibacter sp.]|nr:ice-binding family protein [Ferruginibacter sp.]
MAVISSTIAFSQPPAVAPVLGHAATFGVFSGSGGVTNQGINTIIHGSLGTTSASTTITGFIDGVTGYPYTTGGGSNVGNVTGGIFTNVPAPGDAVSYAFAAQTAADINAAYLSISPAAQPGGIDPGAGELGGLTLTPGVYKASTFNITNLDLTLDAQGDPNAVWVFQTEAGLTVGIPSGARSVIMTNGGLARNVYWYVGSGAIINAAGGGIMSGTVISYAAITTSTAGNAAQVVWNGRALCTSAGITLVNTTINACDTWTGLSNNIWTIATNWSRGSVPVSSEEVLIPNTTTPKPVVSSTTSSLYNLTIYDGSALTVTSTLQIGGFIKNFGNAFDATAGTITMNGDLPQILRPAFTNSNTVQNLIISNPAHVTLSGDINVSNLFTLSNGLLKTGNNNLIIANTATITGASAARYVDGNIRKVGNQAFTFPLGNLNKYAPISISAPVNATDHFTASYSYTNPNNSSYSTTSLGAGLNNVSVKEYWLLNRTNGTSNVDVTLSFDDSRTGNVNVLADLRVARWNGSQWVNEGNTGTTGTPANGTVKSNTVNNFSPFTLGSSTASNSLPLSLLAFSAQLKNSNVALAWQTTNEVNAAHFNLQQSTNGNSFNTVAKINTQGGGNYAYTDDVSSINTSTVFYRLQIVNQDGSFTYSKTIAVLLKAHNAQLSIFPNPVKETLYMQLSSAKNEKLSILIIDMKGSVLQQQEVSVSVGNISLSFNASKLAKGNYVLLIRGDNLIQQMEFVKE